VKIVGVVAEKDVFKGFRVKAPNGVIYAKFKRKRCPLGVFYEFETPLKITENCSFQVDAGESGEVAVTVLFEPETLEEAEEWLRRNPHLSLYLISWQF